MLVTFRSIVIPIKAIILNLLSVGAAYGVLVLVFQDGHGESLLGFTSIGGVDQLAAAVPVRGPVRALDGLPRLHPQPGPGAATTAACAPTRPSGRGSRPPPGPSPAPPPSWSACSRSSSPCSFLDFKELGLGLAVAVLIDATIIRGVLLPASMKLLGDWNWYLPRWLEWLPRVGAERDVVPPIEPGDPETPDEPEPADAPRPAPVPA